MIRATLLTQWLGPFPPWMPCFLASCAPIRSVRWIIFHDHPAPAGAPANVQFVPLTESDFRTRAHTRLEVQAPATLGYKLCDFKITYGALFEDFLGEGEYFGWTDLDLVYGRVDRFLEPLLGRWDVFSFHGNMLSNHLCLLRNDEAHRHLFRQLPDWRAKLQQPGYAELDDRHLTELVRSRGRAYFSEHYTTPFVNWVTWTDGTYAFPRQWRWNRGQVTNNLDVGYEFIYFHFMVWKGGRKPYYCPVKNWEKLPREALGANGSGDAFTLDENGIHAARPRALRSCQLMNGEAAIGRTLGRRLRIKFQRWRALDRAFAA